MIEKIINYEYCTEGFKRNTHSSRGITASVESSVSTLPRATGVNTGNSCVNMNGKEQDKRDQTNYAHDTHLLSFCHFD